MGPEGTENVWEVFWTLRAVTLGEEPFCFHFPGSWNSSGLKGIRASVELQGWKAPRDQQGMSRKAPRRPQGQTGSAPGYCRRAVGKDVV